MKNRLVLTAVIISSLLVGLLAGISLHSAADHRVMAEALFRNYQALGMFKPAEVNLLIDVHERYEKDHEAGADFLKRIIGIKYDKKEELPNVLFENPLESDDYYQTNLKIEAFFKEHPLKECLEVPESERATCSVHNVLPKE